MCGLLLFYDKLYRMSNDIYKTETIYTVNGDPIEISPLKIKNMKEFMKSFKRIESAKTNEESLKVIIDSVRIAMKQFKPEISHSIDLIEDTFDLQTLYVILEHAAGIKFNKGKDGEEEGSDSANKGSSSWEDFDMVKLETEAFLLGIWKNFDELEKSICLAELVAIVSSSRELDYEEKKFLAAMQGVDLDAETNKDKGQKEWEDMKARVFSRGQTSDSNDILALQGPAAKKAGFGVGFGLDYEKVTT